MYKIVLANDYEFEIEEGFSLSNILHIADNDEDACAVSRQITPSNLEDVKFYHDSELIGSYTNLISIHAPMRYDEDDKVVVVIQLREMEPLELRVYNLEKSQMIQDGAIDDLAEVVSDIVEGEV